MQSRSETRQGLDLNWRQAWTLVFQGGTSVSRMPQWPLGQDVVIAKCFVKRGREYGTGLPQATDGATVSAPPPSSPRSPSRGFTVLCLTIRSVTRFEFILVQDVRSVSGFVCVWTSSHSRTFCWKTVFVPWSEVGGGCIGTSVAKPSPPRPGPVSARLSPSIARSLPWVLGVWPGRPPALSSPGVLLGLWRLCVSAETLRSAGRRP